MTRTTTRGIRVALVAACLALVVPLSGCVSAFLPPEPAKTSVPTGETVAADLQPYYSQVLRWSKCEGTFQCATATAPMDWSNPSGKSIELALIRASATGQRLGSLLVNPGGPGGSGYDFIRDSLTYAVDATLTTHYDIVGFDPRGVNKSSAVSCYSDPSQMDAFLFDIPPNPVGSDAWISDLEKSNADFGQACLKYTGDLLGFVDTVSAARDLDLLRAVLGDTKLNYLGYSYGTFLGATYADLYPTKTGHLVLDGAIDPATTDFEVTETQAVGFENAARAYLKDCMTGKGCPFSGTVDGAMAKIRSILDGLDASPLRASDGRMLGSAAMFNAIILPLYSESNWKYLNDLFADVMKGNADYAFQLADAYYGRNADGTYADNSTEAFIAINCLDYISTSSRATLRAEAAELARAAPTFGPQMSYGGTSCDDWPFKATRVRGPIHAAGSAPIIVVGTTNDPATPYQWAKNLASELDNGHLVTYHGEGHTAYNKSNACVNNAVDQFFVSGTVPTSDPDC
ncbi:pimeloyl-ACP methyl ester carboxylesterase [Cryobacterium mesophilum]|uniref:Alpha/beta fold hydrolase n=1 Tax=Terrimesophilobacter mesophilus TaxID=433647 RepID=A0A4R8VEH8_9MICO|nr:alpha/beta fold hydrolase [Terrimesophilobacter mesophilus]MBB5633554.1 pimeloyl-ACP methyl ester carboxylesterase [Terrimesophilobacter mesophilus]TFB80257.1 alpha/beta fold hydrolase [Terrimesophilobacter mesophilus]